MSLKIYDELEQGTPEWLAARRGIVTTSTEGGAVIIEDGKVALS